MRELRAGLDQGRMIPGTHRGADSVVRENAQRFFLWNVPFVTTSLYQLGHGEALGAALDASVVEAVVNGCADAGYALRAVCPTEDTRLVFKPTQPGGRGTPITRRRATAAAGALIIAMAIAVLAPGITAKHTAQRAGRELAMLARRERRADDAAVEAHRNEVFLQEIARFEHARRPVTLLLGALTDALPPESAITTLRSDSAGVDLVVVSSRAAAVLGTLDRVPGIVAPVIVGPISKELAGAHEVERATIHFVYDPDAVKIARKPYAVERQKDE